jgi:hypothetical protein
MTSLFNVFVNVEMQPTNDVLKSLSKKRAGRLDGSALDSKF